MRLHIPCTPNCWIRHGRGLHIPNDWWRVYISFGQPIPQKMRCKITWRIEIFGHSCIISQVELLILFEQLSFSIYSTIQMWPYWLFPDLINVFYVFHYKDCANKIEFRVYEVFCILFEQGKSRH